MLRDRANEIAAELPRIPFVLVRTLTYGNISIAHGMIGEEQRRS